MFMAVNNENVSLKSSFVQTEVEECGRTNRKNMDKKNIY